MPKEISTACLSLELRCLGEDGRRIEADSPEFLEWLQNNGSFRVEAGDNSYRARKESYTGVDYWYAVKKVKNKLHKRFIGRTEEVTCDRLTAVADNIRQPSAKSAQQEVTQSTDQSELKQEMIALKAQMVAIQQQLTQLLEYQGKEIA